MSCRMIDTVLELMNEEEKSDALEVIRPDATDNRREDPDDQGAEFQLFEDVQGF